MKKFCATRITPIKIDWNRVLMKSVNTFFYSFDSLHFELIYQSIVRAPNMFPLLYLSSSFAMIWKFIQFTLIAQHITRIVKDEHWTIFPWCQFGYLVFEQNSSLIRWIWPFDSLFFHQFKQIEKVKMKWNLLSQICECLSVKYGVKDFT